MNINIKKVAVIFLSVFAGLAMAFWICFLSMTVYNDHKNLNEVINFLNKGIEAQQRQAQAQANPAPTSPLSPK